MTLCSLSKMKILTRSSLRVKLTSMCSSKKRNFHSQAIRRPRYLLSLDFKTTKIKMASGYLIILGIQSRLKLMALRKWREGLLRGRRDSWRCQRVLSSSSTTRKEEFRRRLSPQLIGSKPRKVGITPTCQNRNTLTKSKIKSSWRERRTAMPVDLKAPGLVEVGGWLMSADQLQSKRRV